MLGDSRAFTNSVRQVYGSGYLQARNQGGGGGARGAFALPPLPKGPKGPHFDTQYPS